MHKRKPGQPHKGWKRAAAKSRRTILPIARTEPLCFSDVDGLRSCAGMASGSHGSANIGVGDEAASCELKASYVSSGTELLPHNREADR